MMKQRVRLKLVQVGQARRRVVSKPPAVTRPTTDDHRSRLSAIYSQHKELFKRLE